MKESIKARFITFEGCEGAGKSTQIKLLADLLRERGQDVVVTREPGGSDSAELIRDLLVKGGKDKWLPRSEILLHLAARYDHVERLIKPSLLAGKTVLCDRFMDSTMAYQGYGHGLGEKFVNDLSKLIFDDLEPDLTFVFEIDPKKGLDRAKKRGDDDNRYESMGSNFHERVYQGFLKVAEYKRCVLIDASRSIEEIFTDIQGHFSTT